MRALIEAVLQWWAARSPWEVSASHEASAPADPPRLRHAFPFVLGFGFLVQAVLGIAIASYYSPSATDAWASTAYLEDQVTLGWFVRGVHYHLTSVMVVLSALWIATQIAFRTYRAPCELSYLASLAVFPLILGLGLTGNPLPHDQEGYWSIQVELGIAEKTPGGEAIRTLLQGGAQAGNFTLLRLYALHAFVLPIVLYAILRGVRALRKPHRVAISQRLVNLLACWAALAAAVGLCLASHGAGLLGPADPAAAGFQARPAWFFLFLYELRMAFEGPLEPIATMAFPALTLGFLAAIPFIDRTGRGPARMLVLVGSSGLALLVAGLTAFAVVKDSGDEDYQKAVAASHKEADRARELAKVGVPPQGGTAVYWNDPEYRVKELFKEHCDNCHAIDGLGGEEAPDLTDYGSRTWLFAMIRDATAPRFFGNTKHEDMEPFSADELPDDKLHATVEFLVSLRPDEVATVDTALAERGRKLWENDLDCDSCHEIEPGKAGDAPNLRDFGSLAFVERVIADASLPDLYAKTAEMPKFADKLAKEDITALATLIVQGRKAKP